MRSLMLATLAGLAGALYVAGLDGFALWFWKSVGVAVEAKSRVDLMWGGFLGAYGCWLFLHKD